MDLKFTVHQGYMQNHIRDTIYYPFTHFVRTILSHQQYINLMYIKLEYNYSDLLLTKHWGYTDTVLSGKTSYNLYSIIQGIQQM